jgi:hypothetical protein
MHAPESPFDQRRRTQVETRMAIPSAAKAAGTAHAGKGALPKGTSSLCTRPARVRQAPKTDAPSVDREARQSPRELDAKRDDARAKQRDAPANTCDKRNTDPEEEQPPARGVDLRHRGSFRFGVSIDAACAHT